jgi:hypothetical protein
MPYDSNAVRIHQISRFGIQHVVQKEPYVGHAISNPASLARAFLFVLLTIFSRQLRGNSFGMIERRDDVPMAA